MADDLTNTICDPEIEQCDLEPEWKNTIELDYKTPN